MNKFIHYSRPTWDSLMHRGLVYCMCAYVILSLFFRICINVLCMSSHVNSIQFCSFLHSWFFSAFALIESKFSLLSIYFIIFIVSLFSTLFERITKIDENWLKSLVNENQASWIIPMIGGFIEREINHQNFNR